MAEKLGIKELSEGIDFLGTLSSNVADAASDGNFDWWEIAKFRDAAGKLPAAVNGYKQMDDEFGDLSDAEALELKSVFAASLKLNPASAAEEKLIEEGFAAALLNVSFINKVRAYRQAKQETQA